MLEHRLKLAVTSDSLAVCRLEAGASIPAWATAGQFFSVTKTADELSIVCAQSSVPADARCERGWRCLKVEGPLDFSLTGVMLSLCAPLASAGISLFAISTYDTDYLLVKGDDLERAILALTESGHQVENKLT
jgi:hypothetical protein